MRHAHARFTDNPQFFFDIQSRSIISLLYNNENIVLSEDEMQEKRLLERFNLSLPARVTPSSNGHKPVALETRDISARGAFLETKVSYPVGTRLDVDLFLLSLTDTNDDLVRTHGTVTRIEQNGIAIRFAGEFQVMPIDYLSGQ